MYNLNTNRLFRVALDVVVYQVYEIHNGVCRVPACCAAAGGGVLKTIDLGGGTMIEASTARQSETMCFPP